MQKLNEVEILAIRAFVSNYSDLFNKITILEKEMEILSLKKESIRTTMESIDEEITAIRKKEREYNDYLVNKYGHFKLNIETFEIESA